MTHPSTMRRLRKRRLSAAMGLVLMLTGCGSDPSDAPGVTALVETARRLASAKAAPTAPQNPTRAQVVAAGVPVIRLRMPQRGVETFLTRRDRNSGTASWATNDGTVFTFRGGVLISTRALTPDLMSAVAPSPAQLGRNGGSHQRSFFVLGDNDQIDRLDFACTMALQQSETISVIEIAYQTAHMQETCTGENEKFVNDYWIEGNGFIRQSRQWANNGAGHIEVASVVE